MLRPVEERREFQRLHLDPPISGTLGNTPVTILEVGVLGARVHHVQAIEQKDAELRFAHRKEEIDLRCEIVRSLPSRDAKYASGGYESGLRFLAAIGESGDRLRAMLGDLVTREMQNRRAMPVESFGQAVDGDKTVRGADAEYLCYRLENGTWSRKRIFLPEQPAVGFTVARSTDSEEMQHLCRVYQASDAEGRRLIRLFAELSVSDALEIPPRG
ncbi:MAG TPA: hypothetical protein VN605_12045 [Thermoanaerobaculia bacterium]|nr:hypothetical protein [Thermoanaerobaculia bacterium]